MEEKNSKNNKSEAALREEKILEFWRENKTFEKSLAKEAPKGHYVFYDGPPFATGLMHYGHILGSTAKDVIGRYQTMQGFYVPRKWGWDCHGLPIENIVEKDLGVAGHKEIEALGIDVFVEHARSKVLMYDEEWKKSIERMGRWVDFDGGYKTMDNTFIESVWWALTELNKKDLIYEGVRVLAYCARCETPIANSEIAMDNSYRDIADISVYVKFELEDEPNETKTYLLAWTTTPWTLPGNTAIAVNKNLEYIVLEDIEKKEKYIVANDLKVKIFKLSGEKLTISGVSFKGSELVGKKYKPVFPYYADVPLANKENIWKVWHADFVTTEMGTGIAHEAPAFGEDDMNLAREHNIPWIIHVDETGRFKPEVTDFAGLKVKPKDTAEDKDAHLRSDIEVIKYLQKTGAYFDKEKIIHSYPHCMRCDTPIIYYALPSWFIHITKVKDSIEKKAEEMEWIPSHLKDGRFKNIVESAPDWNISRNRYWASPLPIWKCVECKEKTFVSSLADLKSKTKKSGNMYFVMRHGEAEHNVLKVYSSDRNKHHLTEKGKKDTLDTALALKDKKITKIYASPFLRTRETAELVAEKLNIPKEQIIYDDRIRELEFGDFSERPMADFAEYIKDKVWNFDTVIPRGETFQDGKNRAGDFLYDIDAKNRNENILIVTHGLEVEVIPAVIEAADRKRSLEIFYERRQNRTGMVYAEKEFVPLPHNKDYELDLHRPYIDEIKLVCAHSTSSGQACGGEMERIPEVLDGWFESGSMPFAQDHYPFENSDWQKNNFPAGFVAEYVGQVRTWFYYTHAVSTMLFGHAPFQHVVTTGTVRAEDGQKMSKSKGNFPDPQLLFDKYGVDALRIYLMASPLMKGEDANFSEKSVQEIASKIIGRLFNVVSFYELYRDVKLENNKLENAAHVLDQWILSRLNQVLAEVTDGMTAYDMVLAMRPIEAFVEDLSVWYLRRSRDRIKDGDTEAKHTLYFVLKTLATIIAPFAPFTAEDIWLRLKNGTDGESVHLEGWPVGGKVNPKILENMSVTRAICTDGNALRQKLGIPVRQPLNKIVVRAQWGYDDIIKEELNVKKVVHKYFYNSLKHKRVEIDPTITPELKQEGDFRELVRALQDMRKNMGLTPSDTITLMVKTSEIGKALIKKFEVDLQKTVLIFQIEFMDNDGTEIKINDLVFKVKIVK